MVENLVVEEVMTIGRAEKASSGQLTEPHSCRLCLTVGLNLKYAGIRDRLAHSTGTFDFHSCPECESLLVYPLPGANVVAAAYPTTYGVRPPEHGFGLARWLSGLEWRLLFKSVYASGARSAIRHTHIRAGRVLEIGCSTGYQLIEFAGRGKFRLEGIDVDGEAISYAKRILSLSAFQRTLRESEYPSNTFDMVILFNVIEHLRSPMSEVAEIARILKPGGNLVIKTPTSDGLQSRLFGSRWQALREVPRHLLLPSRQGMRALISQVGLLEAGRSSAPMLENAASIALSIMPTATAHYAFASKGGVLRLIVRLLGLVLGLAGSPFALIEGLIGMGGTAIFYAKKPHESCVEL